MLRVVSLSIGGAVGVNARYFLAVAIDRLVENRFPWATLAINVTGAFALGLLSTFMSRLGPQHPARLLLLVGFLGGYTTFSTFTLESFRLMENGAAGRSFAYMFGSVAAGFAAVAVGIAVGRALGPSHPPIVVGLGSKAGQGAEPVGLAEVD